ncbi:hypothetical protein DPMN_190001 [Dreissena polymorpha]|uniref:Uncharacterized protein n=1 Tax=Dreissena polymorpha TaxID=45954 RepID=A0A9D4DVC7_DREPO|nr:hypothetical protein DPMN_190001 [Dreissena polymorpha]
MTCSHQVELVAANGSLVYANENSTTIVDPVSGKKMTSSNTDIFFAVRGGGGASSGIVTSFTFRLHLDSEIVSVYCSAPFYDDNGGHIGKRVLQLFERVLTSQLASEWGGYVIFSSRAAPNTSNYGSITLALNHFGPKNTSSYRTINPFLSAYGRYCSSRHIPAFSDYVSGMTDSENRKNVFTMNTLLDTMTDDFLDFVFGLLLDRHNISGEIVCTGTLIGGTFCAHVVIGHRPLGCLLINFAFYLWAVNLNRFMCVVYLSKDFTSNLLISVHLILILIE